MIFLEEEFSVAEYRSAVLVARRSDDCGRTSDGRFGADNKCQEDAGQGAEDPSGGKQSAGTSSYESLALEMDRRRVQRNIDKGDHAAASKNISLMLEKSTPSKVASALGFERFDLDGTFDEDTRKGRGSFFSYFGRKAVETASRHIATLSLASKAIPEIKKSFIDFSTHRSFLQKVISEVKPKTPLDRSKIALALSGVMAACDLKTGRLSVIQNRANSQSVLDRAHGIGWFSTNDPSHYIVHEYAHQLQHEGMRGWFAGRARTTVSGLESTIASDRFEEYSEGSQQTVRENLARAKQRLSDLSDPSNPIPDEDVMEYRRHVDSEVSRWSLNDPKMMETARTVSKYGLTNGLELAVEYWTAVTLGFRDNDESLDKFCEAIFMPRPKRKKG